MNNAAVSVYVFGIYLLGLVGPGFMVMPHAMLGLAGLSAGDDLWIRVVGLLAALIGFYYVMAARAQLDPFFRWTVGARCAAAAFMVLMVLLGKAGPALLLFAAADLAAAGWTFMSLRSSASGAWAARPGTRQA
jgi:hypothetical protein